MTSSPMPPELGGKVALVTGVGRVGQIGHAVARGFGRAGAKLVLADRDATALGERGQELAAAGYDVRTVAGDLSAPDAARRPAATPRAQFAGVNIAVHV